MTEQTPTTKCGLECSGLQWLKMLADGFNLRIQLYKTA